MDAKGSEALRRRIEQERPRGLPDNAASRADNVTDSPAGDLLGADSPMVSLIAAWLTPQDDDATDCLAKASSSR